MLRSERHFGDRVVACYLERAANLHALLAAAVAASPGAEAVVSGEQRLTYGELDGEVARLAGGLAARGVGRGDRVALLLGNGLPFVALTYAVARLGAVLVPLNLREQTPGLLHAITDSGCRLLVAEGEAAALLPPPAETPALTHRIATGPAEGFEDYEALRGGPAIAEAVAVDEEEVATILYTSGTTGKPKGAMLTGLGIIHSATTYRVKMALGPGDRTIVVVPMSHVTGLIAGIHTAVGIGGAIVVARSFDAPSFLELAARERMNFTILVPAMYALCLHKADPAALDLSCWRIGGYGGAPMPAPTIRRLAEALPQLGLMNCYGATETSSPVAMMPSERTAERPDSVGLPLPGVETLVMDEAGRELPRGEQGELWHRGAMVVPGYWNNPEATSSGFAAGFWKSGDIGSMDEEGFLYVHDRKKDMINRGGYKVFSSEVESILMAVPGVGEVAVVAKPCPILGERVHAVISAAAGAVEEADLAAHCARQLADYQCPESYSFLGRPLPRNANGKVLKRVIREELGFLVPATR